MDRKNNIVTQLTSGVSGLFEANKVTSILGEAKVLSSTQVEVSFEGKSEVIKTKHVIIASGSSPISIPIIPIDQEHIVDSTGALAFDSVPKKLAIIGAGSNAKAPVLSTICS
jgi:dihydrolipoamide dehydrogenase